MRADASGISTCTCRSARTAAATATSSPSSAGKSSTAPTSMRCSSSWSASEGALGAIVATVFVGGGTPSFTDPGRPAPGARVASRRGRDQRRGEPGDRDAGARSAPARGRCDAGSRSGRRPSRRACSRFSSALPVRTTSGARSILFVMPRSTTSRSISSTGSRARSPPTSTMILRRLWRSHRSTSPSTSSRRSRARGSRTPGETSSSASRRRWRGTSSVSSRR